MKILTVTVIIERDPMTKIPKEVYPWEVPLLRAQYGDEKVEILESKTSTFANVDELPDAQEEWLRLRQQYGIEPDTKQSIVDIAYGRGEIGIDALEKVIKKAKLSDSFGETATGKGKGKAADLRGPIEAAQEVVDGNSVDDETAERREAAYRDPLEDEIVHQSNNDVLGAAAGGPGKSK